MSYWDAFYGLVSDLYEVKTLDMNTISGPIIKFGTKVLSNEEQPSTTPKVSRHDHESSSAQNNAEMTIILAKKFLPLFKVAISSLITNLEPKCTPMHLFLLAKSKDALLSTFLYLDRFIWLRKSGIYKTNDLTDRIGRISLYCWLGSSMIELGRLTLENELEKNNKDGNEKYKLQKTLTLITASMDIVVAIGLLRLAPKIVTPCVTGAIGFTSSMISCYQVLAIAKNKILNHDHSQGDENDTTI